MYVEMRKPNGTSQSVFLVLVIAAFLSSVPSAMAFFDENKLIDVDENGVCIVSRVASDFAARKGVARENEIELTDVEVETAWACISPKIAIAFPDMKDQDFLN